MELLSRVSLKFSKINLSIKNKDIKKKPVNLPKSVGSHICSTIYIVIGFLKYQTLKLQEKQKQKTS